MSWASIIKSRLPVKFKNALKDSVFNYLRFVIHEIRKTLIPQRYFGQTAEDVILGIYLPEKVGSYIDIGAGRPVSGSNTYGFYKRGWRGVCVDPISENCRLFRLFRPSDKILNCLVGPDSKSIDFWEFEPYEYSTADQMVADRVIQVDGVRLLEKSSKAILPLSQIASPTSPIEASLLSVDVEGFDLEVLKSNDWEKYRPRVICVEEWGSTLDDSFKSEVGAFLISKNYQRKAWTGLSSIFVEQSYLSMTN